MQKLLATGSILDGNQQAGKVDWKKVARRFHDHKEKIDSDDFHQYVFGIEADLLRNSDLKWLENAIESSGTRVALKNKATYVGLFGADTDSPLNAITKVQAIEMIDRSFKSLSAHWHAESLTNPILTRR